MNWMQSTEIEDIVDHLHQVFLDNGEFLEHQRNGTLEDFYSTLLTAVVSDVVILPVQRELEGLDPLDDPDQIAHVFSEIATSLGIAFGKTTNQVSKDLMNVLYNFPVADYRKAIVLKHQNALH